MFVPYRGFINYNYREPIFKYFLSKNSLSWRPQIVTILKNSRSPAELKISWWVPTWV